MAGGLSTSIERARRHVDGHAADALAWPEFGAALTEVLAQLVPFDATVISMIDPATGLLTDIVRSGIDDSRDELFMHIELTHPDPITMTSLVSEPTGVGILADHVDGDPFRSPRVRDLLSPHFGLEHEMRGVVRSGGQMVAACGLYRSSGRRGFSVDDAAALSSLERSIACGIRRAHGVARSADSGAPHGRPGIESGPAVMILDDHGDVSEMTPVARNRAALLAGASPTGVPHVVRMVAAASRALDAGSEASPVARVCARDGRWFLVSGAPLGNGSSHGRTVVTIEPADVGRTLDLELDLYGLTVRERDVVREVMAGASSSAIARTLAISVHTVQDHLKAVFAKVDVTSRRELVASLTGNSNRFGSDRHGD